jgi:hypothetical protein
MHNQMLELRLLYALIARHTPLANQIDQPTNLRNNSIMRNVYKHRIAAEEVHARNIVM